MTFQVHQEHGRSQLSVSKGYSGCGKALLPDPALRRVTAQSWGSKDGALQARQF
jgi:hypothetical protein